MGQALEQARLHQLDHLGQVVLVEQDKLDRLLRRRNLIQWVKAKDMARAAMAL
jgi:hypothetical protein